MNSEFNLPFCTLILKNHSSEQFNYLNSIFFNQSEIKAKSDFTITVNFQSIVIPTDCKQLESTIFATHNNFLIADSQGKLIRLPFFSFTSEHLLITADPDIDLYFLFNSILEPLIIIWSANHGKLFLHASAIGRPDNKAVILTAWQNTGKTHFVLSATQDQKFAFMGDDFCIVYKGQAYLYPKTLNLFSYNFIEFPHLFSKLDLQTKYRIRFALIFKKMIKQLGMKLPFPFSKIAIRISELAEIASNYRTDPNSLNMKTLSTAKLESIYLLEKTSDAQSIKLEALPKSSLHKKLLRIIQYELKEFFALYQQYVYFFPDDECESVAQFSRNYQSLLEKYVQSAKRIPFNSRTNMLRLIEKIT